MKILRNIFILFGAALFVAACGSSADPGASSQQNAGSEAQQRRPSPESSWAEYTDEANNGYSDRVFFETDRHDLSPEARETISAWARWLEAHPDARVLVEGHADERGTREYNLALGARRAISVRNYLAALGVDPRRMRTVSFGKERPEDPRSTPDAWAANRRAVAVPRQGGA
jgi:peptidoglycan-associated lipoprotein